jgi:hypothetical protein
MIRDYEALLITPASEGHRVVARDMEDGELVTIAVASPLLAALVESQLLCAEMLDDSRPVCVAAHDWQAE